jgi:hypothetical protein
LAFASKRRREEDAKNPFKSRQRKAKATVRNELHSAKKQLSKPELFFPALGQGVEQYLLSKLTWSSSQYQRDDILEALENKAPETVRQWKTLLDQLDMARYAPGSIPEPQEMLTLAEQLVEQTEKSWRKS